MAGLAWAILLLIPTGMAASEFALPTARTRTLFSQQVPEKTSWTEFGDLALGSLFGIYPYHAQLDDLPAYVETHGSFAVPGWLEARAAAMYSSGRGLGVSADAYATFLLFGAGGALRHWGRGEDERRGSFTTYGWLGLSYPFPAISASLGAAYGYMNLPNATVLSGFSFTSRITAYPLWPLSFSADVAVGSMSGVVIDAGGSIGVMAFRHLFVEVGYRFGAAYKHDFTAHGVTLGIQFAWGWANSRFGLFAAPRHPWTW